MISSKPFVPSESGRARARRRTRRGGSSFRSSGPFTGALLIPWLVLLAVGCKESAPDEPPAHPGAPAAAADAVSAEAAAAVDALRFDDEATVAAVVALADDARPLLQRRLAEGDVVAAKNALAAYAGSRGMLPPLDLRAALERDDPVIRRLALQAAAKMRQGELFAIVRERIADDDLEVRREAVRTIAGLEDPRVQETLVPLLELVSPRDVPVGDAAAEALGAVVGSVKPVVALLRHESPVVRRRALEVLAVRGVPATAAAVEGLVNDPDPAVRQQALRTLAMFGTGRSLEQVRPLLTEEDPEVRRFAVDLLRHFDPREVRALVWQALDDADPLVRQIATAQLHRYDGNPALAAALATRLADERPTVRIAAVAIAQGLQRLPEADRLLLERIRLETDPKVFAAMGRAFRERRSDEPAFRALVAALGDARGVAAEGIGEALHVLTGQPFGTDAWAWRNWAAQRAGQAGADAPDAGSSAGAADASASPAPAPAPTPHADAPTPAP